MGYMIICIMFIITHIVLYLSEDEQGDLNLREGLHHQQPGLHIRGGLHAAHFRNDAQETNGIPTKKEEQIAHGIMLKESRR